MRPLRTFSSTPYSGSLASRLAQLWRGPPAPPPKAQIYSPAQDPLPLGLIYPTSLPTHEHFVLLEDGLTREHCERIAESARDLIERAFQIPQEQSQQTTEVNAPSGRFAGRLTHDEVADAVSVDFTPPHPDFRSSTLAALIVQLPYALEVELLVKFLKEAHPGCVKRGMMQSIVSDCLETHCGHPGNCKYDDGDGAGMWLALLHQ
ncbi:hypothetical protein B0A48_13452 [Cryoendolithus antarcticus]|uniref:Uncharacterized protein n=1 Tax=Cryoendolithus antarcticus TaxID=1507870 RepID=A0A1V8SQ41_9PEZI|nr:hypothetical protein B0A48_13452 [Cryoendolithus antarcticus]